MARRFTDEQEQEICRRYQAGESSHALMASFGVANSTIFKILKRQQIGTRSIKESRGGLTAKQEEEACNSYLNGVSAMQLGRSFGVDPSTIANMLKRKGIKTRSVGEAIKGITDAQRVEMCIRYLAGENTVQLSHAFGFASSTIGSALKRCGIELRSSDGFGDAVRCVLDGTGYHDQRRECEFYLYELARYSATHCKPGIAFDAGHRAASSVAQGEYGEAVLLLTFATRAEAYFLEQAVLDATRGYRDCPDDLAGWGGASEVRAMPAEDMVPIVLRLAEELEAMGAWAFAAGYVPMTAAQRLTCQQRAMELAHAESL